MTRLRNEVDFVSALDREFAWRLKEIDDLKKSIRAANLSHRRTLIRAGLALLYAHWEGFVKASSELYLNYLAHKKIPYQELRLCLVALGLRGHLATVGVSSKAESNILAVKFIMNNLDKPAKLPFKDSIDTSSNLSSTVFKTIAEWIGVDSNPYMAYSQFIDSSLLERRNKIAHGEAIDLEIDDYYTLTNEVIKLIRFFKTDLENSAINKLYLTINI